MIPDMTGCQRQHSYKNDDAVIIVCRLFDIGSFGDRQKRSPQRLGDVI